MFHSIKNGTPKYRRNYSFFGLISLLDTYGALKVVGVEASSALRVTACCSEESIGNYSDDVEMPS